MNRSNRFFHSDSVAMIMYLSRMCQLIVKTGWWSSMSVKNLHSTLEFINIAFIVCLFLQSRVVIIKGRNAFLYSQTQCNLDMWIRHQTILWLNAVSINLLRPSDAYPRLYTEPSLVPIIACRLFGTKPLSEPKLVYCELEACKQISEKF